MQRMFLVFLTALLGLSATAARAADGAARARAIAPFVEKQTIAVGYVDLARVAPDPLVAELAKVAPEAIGDPESLRQGLSQVLAAIRNAGFDELYVTVNPADAVERIPAVLLPLTPKSNVEALPASVKTLTAVTYSGASEPIRGMLVIANPPTLQRLRQLQTEPRPELEAALAATAGAPVQVVLLPNADHRRVIEELMPELPPEIGGGPSTTLTHGLVWGSWGIDLPPQLALRMVIQSRDPAAAAALAAKWNDVLPRVVQWNDPEKTGRRLERLPELLATRADGDRVLLDLPAGKPAIESLVQALAPPIETALQHGWRGQSSMHLKQIMIALHTWHDKHKSFPAPVSYDAAGRPLLSWRVHILPLMDQQALHDQFHLDEPWDSPHNRALIEKMPEIYRSPAARGLEPGRASYVLPIGEGTVFPGTRGLEIKEITDGTSNTIAVIEVDAPHSPIWTKPDDFPFDPQKPREGLGGVFPDGFLTAFADGAVHFIPMTVDDETLRCLFLRADGTPVRIP